MNLSGLHRPVTEGDNVTLTCNITDGVPKPNRIRWLKDKTPLDETKTKLVLQSIKKEQKGTYTCETSNEGGSASDSTNIIVDSKAYESFVDLFDFHTIVTRNSIVKNIYVKAFSMGNAEGQVQHC